MSHTFAQFEFSWPWGGRNLKIQLEPRQNVILSNQSQSIFWTLKGRCFMKTTRQLKNSVLKYHHYHVLFSTLLRFSSQEIQSTEYSGFYKVSCNLLSIGVDKKWECFPQRVVFNNLVSERGQCRLSDFFEFLVCSVVAAMSKLPNQKKFLEIISVWVSFVSWVVCDFVQFLCWKSLFSIIEV